MKTSIRNIALMASTVTPAIASSASQRCTEENGNWYCQQTKAITYDKFGQAGSYKKITAMDPDSGACSSQSQSYNGGLAPLDDEVSWHFRGPVRLKQFAFYTLGQAAPVITKPRKRTASQPLSHRRRHSHRFLHQWAENDETVQIEEGTEEIVGNLSDETADAELNQRDVGDWVTVTMNGEAVSWINNWSGAPAAATVAPPASNADPEASSAAPTGINEADSAEADTSEPSNPSRTFTTTISLDSVPVSSAASESKPSPSASSSETIPDTKSGAWLRQSYYSSDSPETTENVVFLGNHGDPSCSGTFDYKFGLSQSYLTPDGQHCSPSPQALGDVLLPDNTEISLVTASKCTDDDPCPYYRPGNVAHHGFGGASKLFLFEISMPQSGQRGGLNSDMPAVWILNAEIPRTLQYGNAECSCWESGCGEFDVMEVLDSGNAKMKSTWHGQRAIGDSDWFERPTQGSRKAAVVMDGQRGRVSVLWLDDEMEFGGSVMAEEVERWLTGIGRERVTLGSA